jgi:hypothetical protein
MVDLEGCNVGSVAVAERNPAAKLRLDVTSSFVAFPIRRSVNAS